MRASTGPRMARRGCACQLPLTVLLSIKLFRICGKDLLSASNTSPSTTSARSKSAAARPSSPSRWRLPRPPRQCCHHPATGEMPCVRPHAQDRMTDRQGRQRAVPDRASSARAAICRFTKSCRSLCWRQAGQQPVKARGRAIPRQTGIRGRACLRNAEAAVPLHEGCFRTPKRLKGEVFGNHGDKQHQKAHTACRQRPASGSSTLICQRCRAVITASASCRSRLQAPRSFRRFQNLAHGKRNDIRLDRAVWRGNHTQARQRIPPQFRMCAAKQRQSAVRAAGLNTSRISA